MPASQGFKLFCSNWDLLKLQLACCSLMGGSVGTGMIVPTLKTRFWGRQMSSYSSMFDAVSGLMTLMFTPWFGRLSDRISRRKAWLITGVSCFIPTGALLVGGAQGLWLFEALGVLTAPIRQVQLMYFIYLQDLVPPDDLNLIFSTGFAVFTASTFVISLVASYVANHSTGAFALCVFDFVFLIFFLLLTHSMKKPSLPGNRSQKGKSSTVVVSAAAQEELDQRGGSSAPGDFEEEKASLKSVPAEDSRGAPERRKTNPSLKADDGGSNMRTIHFLCSNPNLRNLAIIFFLIGLPETMERHIAPQFKFQTLDLMLTGNHTIDEPRIHEQKVVTEISKLTFILCATFYGLAIGVIGSKIGPLNSMKMFIPVAAVSQLLPMLLFVDTARWVIGAIAALAPMGVAVKIPLQALTSIVSPPDRVGEAVSAVTAVKEFAPLLANMMVPPLLSFFGTGSLWVFFVISCLMILMAMPFAYDMDVVKADEEGSDDEDSEDEDSEDED